MLSKVIGPDNDPSLVRMVPPSRTIWIFSTNCNEFKTNVELVMTVRLVKWLRLISSAT